MTVTIHKAQSQYFRKDHRG